MIRGTGPSRVTAPQFAAALRPPQAPVLLDVRNLGELAKGAIVGARHIAIAQLPHRLARWLGQ